MYPHSASSMASPHCELVRLSRTVIVLPYSDPNAMYMTLRFGSTCADPQGDSISRVFDDPKGLFASAPVNTALTKSKSRDSTEKLASVGTAATTTAAMSGYESASLNCSVVVFVLALSCRDLSVGRRHKLSALNGYGCLCLRRSSSPVTARGPPATPEGA